MDFLETLRKYLCSRLIICYRFVEVFWCFYLTLKSTPKNAYKLDQSHILSFWTPKIVILILLIL
jgi:hypothetical protein